MTDQELSRCKRRFDAKWTPEPVSGCWLWIGAQTRSGYGAFWLDKSQHQAHRVAWRVYRHGIPPGLLVLHRCDVKLCVNPDHLFLGTQRENYHDAVNKERIPRRLFESDVLEIRSSNRSQRELAEKFGVHQSLISRIKHLEVWRDTLPAVVPPPKQFLRLKEVFNWLERCGVSWYVVTQWISRGIIKRVKIAKGEIRYPASYIEGEVLRAMREDEERLERLVRSKMPLLRT